MEWRSSRKCELADEEEGVWGVWGSDEEVSLRREGAEEGEVSCSPASVLVLVLVDEAKDEGEGEDADADEG